MTFQRSLKQLGDFLRKYPEKCFDMLQTASNLHFFSAAGTCDVLNSTAQRHIIKLHSLTTAENPDSKCCVLWRNLSQCPSKRETWLWDRASPWCYGRNTSCSFCPEFAGKWSYRWSQGGLMRLDWKVLCDVVEVLVVLIKEEMIRCKAALYQSFAMFQQLFCEDF